MDESHPLSLCVAAAAATAAATAALCLLTFIWSLKRHAATAGPKPQHRAGGAAADGGGAAPLRALPNGDAVPEAAVVPPPPSIMEQLVPEITTHTLSYLDYRSLCRLSMTNSAMRRAANDDGAWKALYRKDFTIEQDNITPPNGWKAYYAATKAIVNVNAEFYDIIRERSVAAMRRFWLQADYVKCVHGNDELYKGYNAVINSWSIVFGWDQEVEFQIRDVRARALTDTAWVTMKVYTNLEGEPLHVTNIYEFHNGRWYMVHHHSSPALVAAPPIEV